MSGTPVLHAVLLLAALVVLLFATRRAHPFVALLFVATAFGFAAGLSTSLTGKAFGSGFSQALYSPGLVVVAAALITALADAMGATAHLTTTIDRGRGILGHTRLAALLGLVAGIGALPATAFALLAPLLRPLAGAAPTDRKAVPVTLALAISCGHGLILFAPAPIVAASILDASWSGVAAIGIPLAIVVAACGTAWARLGTGGKSHALQVSEPHIVQDAPDRRATIVLIVAIAVPLAMLLEQSLGEIPSEPLGGGTARELVIGIGRPLILFVVGTGIMIVALLPQSMKLLADGGWTTRILGTTAPVLLTVGTAGGLQRLCQETGMAELLGEKALAWHLAGPVALLVPFAAAATIKTLQGSSLVAAITAAGMIAPFVTPLGFDGDTGRTLVTLAVGIGAMTVSHINDEFFWLVTDRAGLSPLGAISRITLGTLFQGVVAVALLILIAAVAG